MKKKDNIQIPGRTLHGNDYAVQRTPYGPVVITNPQHTVHVEGVNTAVVEMTLITVDLIFVNFDNYKSVCELELYFSHHKHG